MKISFNGNVFETENGQKIKDIFKEELEKENKSVLGCRVNNEVKSLDYALNENSKVEFIKYACKDGIRIYRRGLVYIMSMAIEELYPGAYVRVNYQLSNSLYCDISNMEITEEMIRKNKRKND